MESTAVLRSLEALMREDPEVAESFLMAALYCRALRSDSSPRDVLDALWKAMPSADAWPGLRAALAAALDDDPAGRTP